MSEDRPKRDQERIDLKRAEKVVEKELKDLRPYPAKK